MTDNLEDLAYEKIKVAISRGYIKKGEKLKEVPMAKNLKMSRATVKGAFKRLVHEGLAEYRQNKGVSVVNPSLEDIKESFQVRAQLEKMSTTLAAGKFDPEDIDALQTLICEEESVFTDRKLDKYYQINSAFHLKIAQKSGNRVLVHYVTELLQKTTIYLILFDPFYQLLMTNNPSPQEHRKIVRYLEINEAEKAGNEIKNHLESSLRGIDLERLLPDGYLTA